jgi:rubrerythrin
MTRPPSPEMLEALHEARAAERAQALFYRALAAQAEDAGSDVLSERFNELHADEQHHLSRLTARLIELGQTLPDLSDAVPGASLETWEDEARSRERDEVARYERLLGLGPDTKTSAMLQNFLEVERAHERELAGKWMDA